MADTQFFNQSPLQLFKTSLRLGLGFGLAMALVHLGHGIGLLVALGQPPLTVMALQSFVMEIALSVPIALILCPLLALNRGRLIHALAMIMVFIVMERWVAVDPSKLPMWIAPSLVGGLVYAIGRRIWSKKPIYALGTAGVLLVVLLLIPIIRHSMTTDENAPSSQGQAPDGAPDVLFIVMDTVRAQSSSTYGYERETTPVLSGLAKEGILFQDATSPATWSLPAHAALFTGTFPSYNNAHGETRYLDGKLPTIADSMALAGWDTYCFSANPHISDSFGLTRGFMNNDKAWQAGDGARGFSFIFRMIDVLGLGMVQDKGGSQVVDNIDSWLESRPENDKPAFVFVNFLEAHFPFHQLPDEFLYKYQQRDISELRSAGQVAFGVQFGRQLTDSEYETVRQPLVDMYDGGVLYTDYLAGKVIDLWRQKGLLDNTVVVVLSDHGEVMGEHGAFGHVTPVVEEDLRVPMVMRYPQKIKAGTVVSEPVSTVGVYATIMELADLPRPPMAQVGSLLSESAGADLGKPILAERFEEHMLAARFEPGTANGVGPQVNPRGRYRTFRDGDYKLVQHSTDGYFLYNLKEDPEEKVELSAREPGKLTDMRYRLEDWLEKLKLPRDINAPVDMPRDKPEMSKEEEEALKALGYLE